MPLIPQEKHSTDSKILLFVSVNSALSDCYNYYAIPNSTITDDDNRIVLKSIPGAIDCQGDYINACYIDVRSSIKINYRNNELWLLIIISIVGILSSW